jgi:peptidoglycan/LPS O-acetylase OafA/YrhL
MLRTFQSLENRLIQTCGRPNGFDYLRLCLALGVIGIHSVTSSYGIDKSRFISESIWRAPMAAILPMFFGVSRFLVAASLERSKSLPTFMGLRALRILPALAGEVLLPAFILRPLLTSFPHSAYFSDPLFYKYFLNLIGNIQYTLPGLFQNNPLPATVNGHLWSIPYELDSYGILVVLTVLGIIDDAKRLLATAGICYLMVVKSSMPDFPTQLFVEGNILVLTFMTGAILYRFRHYIPWSGLMFSASLVLMLILLYIPNGDRFAPLPTAYATAYLGLLNPPRHKILLSGDYSYGIYVYGFPVQQAFMSIGPAVQHWYWNPLLAIPCTLILAVLSWRYIEKPVLHLRIYLKKTEAQSNPKLADSAFQPINASQGE